MEIEYDNKQVTRIDCAELTVAQILEQVQSRAEEMDTAQVRHVCGMCVGVCGRECVCEWVGGRGSGEGA